MPVCGGQEQLRRKPPQRYETAFTQVRSWVNYSSLTTVILTKVFPFVPFCRAPGPTVCLFTCNVILTCNKSMRHSSLFWFYIFVCTVSRLQTVYNPRHLVLKILFKLRTITEHWQLSLHLMFYPSSPSGNIWCNLSLYHVPSQAQPIWRSFWTWSFLQVNPVNLKPVKNVHETDALFPVRNN